MKLCSTMGLSAVALGALLFGGVLLALADTADQDHVVLECRITQNMEQIRLSNFGEPPQWAFWLEDPESGDLQTVQVTYRSASGDWVGKLECPACLPRWFSVYREEFDEDRMPWLGDPLPDALSGATPLEEKFQIIVEIPKGKPVFAWFEVNMSADFNTAFPPPGASGNMGDTDHDGQPSLIYRAELTATPGEKVEPEPWGYSRPGTRQGAVERDLEPLTTAKEIFQSIAFHVLEAE